MGIIYLITGYTNIIIEINDPDIKVKKPHSESIQLPFVRRNLSPSNLQKNIKILPITAKVSKVISIEIDHPDSFEYAESLRFPTFGDNKTKTFEALRDPEKLKKIIAANLAYHQPINDIIDKNTNPDTNNPFNIGFGIQNSISDQRYSDYSDNIRNVEPIKYIKTISNDIEYVELPKYIELLSYNGPIFDDKTNYIPESLLKYKPDLLFSPKLLIQNYNLPQSDSLMGKFDISPNGISSTQDINNQFYESDIEGFN